jgi:ABC-type multidrug transport system fused ATPase/permease subunit
MESQKDINNTPGQFFEAERRKAAEAEIVAQKNSELLATGRLAAFFAIFLTIWLWNKTGNAWCGLGTLIALALFLLLMRRQQAAKKARDFQRNLQTVNEDEKERLNFKFKRTDNGSYYQEKNHAFASDLDIFGDYSLYRLLNRTRTAEGSRRLAKWLKNHAPLDEILMRQEAAEEFKRHTEFRQTWEATALLHKHAAQQIGAFREWSKESLPADLAPALKWRWWSLITLFLGVLVILGLIPGWVFALSLAWHLVILRRFQEQIQSITNRTTSLGHTLVAYADLLQLSESAPFHSRWWKIRYRDIKGASAALRQAGNLFARLDYRNNPFFLLFVGIPTFWDMHILAGLESWKKTHGQHLDDWLNALADTEAMNSLAGHAFANPDHAAPQVLWADDISLEAETMGHPLIPKEKRIDNSFQLKGTGQTILVTGSNMSGKSTFLRTLGLNIVLAQMGAVVTAARFSCSPMRVFSSMRTQDSLEESTSSFYAELKRLKQLLEISDEKNQAPVFYMLDEILKGTNSSDRHKGAEALIRQLHGKRASGLVSTHDLELGEWGATESYVKNFHFRSDVADGQLHFDYRLHEGICRSFNASELMRMMGIDMDALQSRSDIR